MKKKYQQLARWIQDKLSAITPGRNAFKGAGIGLLAIAGILWLAFASRFYINLRDPWVVVLCLVFLLLFVLSGFLIRWGLKKLQAVPPFY